MAKTQSELNQISREKRGIKKKAFDLDSDTAALFEKLAAHTGQTQVQVLKAALSLYEKHLTGRG